MVNEENFEYVIVHPLIVDNIEVIIMPEVTRVLRLVYQVIILLFLILNLK